MLAKTLHNLNSSNWVVGVKKNSTLSTNILFRDSISDAGNSGQWAWVCSALGGRCPLETNVTSLTPGASPAVTNDPVVSILSISSVSNKLDSWKKILRVKIIKFIVINSQSYIKSALSNYYKFNVFWSYWWLKDLRTRGKFIKVYMVGCQSDAW